MVWVKSMFVRDGRRYNIMMGGRWYFDVMDHGRRCLGAGLCNVRHRLDVGIQQVITWCVCIHVFTALINNL